MHDSAVKSKNVWQCAMSDESWVMSFFDNRTEGHVFSFESYVLMSNPFGEICAICVSKNFGRSTQTSLPLITQNSPLIAHHSLLKNLSFLRHRRSIVFICQKTRKRDFGPSEENSKITNPLIVKQIQNHEKPFENIQKKDLSVSWVLLKSFRSNT